MQASHEFLEHTSELELRIRAPTFADLIAEAARALAELMLRGRADTAPGPWRKLTVHSADRGALLVDWLNELIYRAETELWVPIEIRAESVSDRCLSVQARGVAVEEAPALVKAATFHRLRVDEVADGLEAEVILDV